MTEATRKEDLSCSYISAVCAYGGIDYEKIHHDDDSTDVLLKKNSQIGERSKIYINTEGTIEKHVFFQSIYG